MRRTSPPFHLLAAAAASDAATATTAVASTTVMSSRPPHRGRGRGSSGRSYSGGRGQFVTGDAHFRSVRDANLGFRRGERGSFSNQTQHHQNPPYNPRPPPPYNQNPQFRHPYPHPSPQFRPSPPFNHKQAFRPPQHLRPRPPDYRDWEYATTPPPPHCDRFIVLSYNILADYLAIDHRNKLYIHIPRHMLDWEWRKRNIIFELGLWSADIMCLQEVDRFHDLAEELKLKGYSGIWKMRTGNPIDGCAIFWRTSRFNLLYEECIEFNKLGLRDNVAQICALEFINQNGSLPSSMTGSSKVVICNIHVLYNPNRGEIKLGQVRLLLDRAKAVSSLWNNAPVVICGDFNCTPKSPLYNFISEQKLDLSGIDRDKVSGQASATIRMPRLYGPNSSERSANDSVQATSIAGDKEVNIEESNSLSDMQNPDNKGDSLENQYTHAVLNVSNESGTNVQCGKESDTCAGKDTHQSTIDNSKTFGEIDSIKEEQDPSYNEGSFPVDDINDEIHGITPVTSSALKAVHTDTTGIGCTENVSDAVSTSSQESLRDKSNFYGPRGNKHMEFDSSPTCLQEANQSSRDNIDFESTDLLSVEVLSTSSWTSVSNACEVPQPGYKESPSNEIIANDQMNSSSTSYLIDKSHQVTNFDFPLDEKLEKSFLDEIDKAIGSENIGEDDKSFISSLHNAKEDVALYLGSSMKSHLKKSNQLEEPDSASNNLLLNAEGNEVENDLSSSLNSLSIDAEKTTYNPSLWTPVEIETATGNAECTSLEHPLPLRSTYTEVVTQDCSGTRDPHGEPLVTSYNRCFLGTVDYIWRSEGLQTTRVLAPIPKHAMEWTPGFPTKKWGSDHIALVSELAFLKDGTDISRDV